jgi:hypothetical protein
MNTLSTKAAVATPPPKSISHPDVEAKALWAVVLIATSATAAKTAANAPATYKVQVIKEKNKEDAVTSSFM